ncbi:MAG: hypothetical protein IAG13_17305 [Deltaproteobacteria bacterium]|nr:hypothetical protein [Nannocystaceae bacterium]
MSVTHPLALSIVLLSACDSREPEGDAQPPTPAAPSEPTLALPKAAIPVAAAQPIDIAVAEIRRSGAQVEIEIAVDRKLPATSASRPVLHVGDQLFRRSRRANGQLDRLVFIMTAAELDALDDGAIMIVRDRGVSSDLMASPPVLDKSKVVVTP